MLRHFLTLGIGALMATSAASGQVIFNTGAPPNPTGNAWEMSGFNEAMNFTLDSDASLTGAHIWTTFQNGTTPLPDNGFRGYFDWTIFTDDGTGLPGSAFANGRSVPTLTSRTIFGPGFDISEWDIPIVSTPLSAETRYWLSLHNTDASGSYVSQGFFWGGSVNPPNTVASASQANGTGPWTSNPVTDADYFGYGNRLAMTLYGTPTPSTVPEPSTLALFGTGLVGLVPIIRRRVRPRRVAPPVQ